MIFPRPFVLHLIRAKVNEEICCEISAENAYAALSVVVVVGDITHCI
jgi:hypothetical protein